MGSIVSSEVDVVIVGAGVAGTTCAIKLQKAGFQVMLVDRRKSLEDYKTLCTHFIQPFSIPGFKQLGLSHLFSEQNSVATKAAFFVPGGVIDPEGTYGGNELTTNAYNLERRVMDPLLRQAAIDCGVELRLGTAMEQCEQNDSGFSVTLSSQEADYTVTCDQVIAADGRRSKLARLMEVESRTYPNDRAAYFCYCTGIEAPKNNRSLFSLNNDEMSFLYPLIGGRSLLSVYIHADRAKKWNLSYSSFDNLLALFKAHLPDVDFSQARLESKIYSYAKYDNQLREPVNSKVAFIGDASLSLDPMSGVGCSFAMKSAMLLGDAIIEYGISNAIQRESALDSYAQAYHAFFDSHAKGIIADAQVGKNIDAVSQTYRVILNDPKLQKRYIDLTGRIITPEQFQSSYLLAVAKQRSVRNKNAALVEG
ncbi:hypothetical protein VHA01S_031_00060 [Vibrio halioticoli NBRC 102217]|uniref:Protein CbrA n=1 Tax=Vibrio halioticoli NBRC 102217 TaxID=1219072 RepID=V5FEA6_9VIBR|nr:NAD(P)/FAD-dependent oxidoreductase [Vibrio halioticoli]GAD89993.1 hypothetical protein VHA01S_031_00060 [Vibrio halioticoli NBRC 102217]